VSRLLAGTPWDRPPRCERCDRLESECDCPPPPPEPPRRLDPAKQSARLRVEKRPRGKVVTTVRGLDPSGNDLTDLLRQLKQKCGAGGTLDAEGIEIQGAHLDGVEAHLAKLGYKTRRG